MNNELNTSDFVYGSELQGRGYVTQTDIIFGTFTTATGIVALCGAMLNFYFIKNLKAFHNPFGFFWAVRTVGELGSDIVYAIYTGPITLVQSTSIPPGINIFAYHLAMTFGYIQCLMHWGVSVNRLVAVWFPFYYDRIFNKKLCVIVVIGICLDAFMIVSLYLLFPCNHIGYSPQLHENVFVKCSPEQENSLLTPIIMKACYSIACAGTALINLTTFGKIAYIRITSKVKYNNVQFRRDIRLFIIGVMQDINMVVVIGSIVVYNNEANTSTFAILLSYDGLVFIYILNTFFMTFFNPECRRFLFKTGSKVHTLSYIEPTEGPTTQWTPESQAVTK
uniref:7TM_GPCR_Srx domain-containing protein n=1 Tax=Steinernema glaseri TaxID=37863 RepID=A0A1I7Y228_9BILA